MPSDYEIGYRRPPASGQFKKGSSGNPKGRPKGSNNLLTLIVQELSQKITVTENGRRKTITRLQAMVKRMVAGALQGDQKQLLTLVEIMRKSGGLEPTEIVGLLPDNFEEMLDAYVQTHRGVDNPTESVTPTRRRRGDDR